MVSSSARNPNESYAERAKKASTRLDDNNVPAPPPTVKVNVWAERIKKDRDRESAPAPAPAAPVPAVQSAQMAPRPRETSSPSHPHRDDAILPRSPPPDLSAQLAILDQRDEHDPFVVRVPPHLSRQSSSSTNPLPVTDPSAWPLLSGADPHSNASSVGYDSSTFASAAPSRQNSIASVRHHPCSPPGSVRLPRVQSSFSHHSRSASHSRAHSRSGSSASSPRLQIRGRTLPPDDAHPPDLRLDPHHRRSSNKRSSPVLSDPPNNISSPFQIDPSPSTADPSHHRHPSLQDMAPRYAHNLVSQYALTPNFPFTHVPGHASPPYMPPHSGQGTPPYPHYPPYPAYMYAQPPLFWGDIAPHSHNHLQSHTSISPHHANVSELTVQHQVDFGSTSPAITSDSSKHPAQLQNGLQPKPSKNVVFGTIGPVDAQDDSTTPDEAQRTAAPVEQATEQFASFSIGVSPDEPGPSRLASRKSSVKSFFRSISQPSTNEGTNDGSAAFVSLREVNGTIKPIKWEFGTTVSGDLDDPRPPSSPLPPSIVHRNNTTDDQPDPPNGPPEHHPSHTNHSLDRSEAASNASDVWVVKDYGFGFGNHSGSGNAPDVVRWEMREREKERVRESQREREVLREQRERGWVSTRQPGWRHENGLEEGWEQPVHADVPRHMRSRRGSLSGYGAPDRGGFNARRGRAFGGRFHGGRGRGNFFHHQRPGSYQYGPPSLPGSLPFDVLPPAIDTVNGSGSYPQPDHEPYEAVSPLPQSHVPFTLAAYSYDAMRNCLLGQLVYYLSPQNMAQDFYLRQRMDHEGWISISLLASFKRIQQLHTDADIVRDVLSQSPLVEVSGDWVRIGGRQWEPFVLPDAPKSVVTGFDHGEGRSSLPGFYHEGDVYAEAGETEGDCDGEECEDEDDDVEFVIGEEAEGSWMPVPDRKQ